MHPGWTIALSVFGAAAEVFGLVVGLAGYARIWRAIAGFARSSFPGFFRPKTITETVTNTVVMKSSLQTRVIRGSADSIEDRIDRLETITDDIYREIDDRFAGVDARVSEAFQKGQAEAAERIDSVAARVDGEVRLDRRNLRDASVWIVLGIMASAAANIVGASG